MRFPLSVQPVVFIVATRGASLPICLDMIERRIKKRARSEGENSTKKDGIEGKELCLMRSGQERGKREGEEREGERSGEKKRGEKRGERKKNMGEKEERGGKRRGDTGSEGRRGG